MAISLFLIAMFCVTSFFVINGPTRDLLVPLHKAVISKYGWHISIIITMFVNTTHWYKKVEI